MKSWLFLLLGSGWIPLSHAGEAPPAADPNRDALGVQNARAARGATQRDQQFYTRTWDLGGLPDYVPEQIVSGVIRLRGNDAINRGRLFPYLEEGFRKFHPDVRLDIDLKSSAVAIPALLMGAADIGIGRHILFMELLGFQRTFNHDPLELVPLNGAYDTLGWNPAWVVVVNKKNPLTGLSVRQLDGILGAERNGGWAGTTWHPEFARGPEGNIRTWGQLGLTGEWADKPIRLFGTDATLSGWSGLIQKVVFKGGDKWNPALQELVRGGAEVPADAQIVSGVADDRYALGFSFMRVVEQNPQVKPLALAAETGGPLVPPTRDTFHDRSYPLVTAVYIYLNRPPGQPVPPRLKEFLAYVLSREGQQAVIDDGMFIPLTAEAAREQLAKLQ